MEGWWAASYAVLWVLVLVLGVMVVALARQIGTLHLRLGPRGALEMDDEGPPLNEAPPPVEATALDGTPVTVGGPGQSQLLMFVSPGCLVCDRVLPSVPVIARSAEFEGVVITDVDAHETVAAFGSKSGPLPMVASPELTQSYAVPGTPFLVILDDKGLVRAKGTVNNLEQMEGLVETGLRRVRAAQLERVG
ncbi:MAG: methylamine dehydrogenase accessory protein MauD [Actinomycetota bacterium]